MKTYIENLTRIRDECRKRNIQFVVATQQAKSMSLDRDEIRGVKYAEEVELVENKLEESGSLRRREAHFRVHSHLMSELREWATASDTPLVDIIEALDEDRDVLLSWVHVSRRGNEIIASEFAESILQLLRRSRQDHGVDQPA